MNSPTPLSEKLKKALFFTSVVAISAWFLVGCYFAIANYWQWGHNGFNSAAYSQAARNTLRFWVWGQARMHMGLTPPHPHTLYLHHPIMIHFHIIITHAIFGFSEWAGRIVPATYSFLTLPLLYKIVKDLSDRKRAVISMFIYALLPINLIFANMIDHEQGGIFWCLLLVYSYILWIKDKSKKHFIYTMINVTMATQFDWPGYYIALFLALHIFFVTVIKYRKNLFSWRKEYTWIAVFSAVVLLNAALLFGFFYFSWGGADDIIGAFFHRSAPVTNYLKHNLRVFDIWGAIPFTLLATWLIYFTVKTLRGKAGYIDFIAIIFFLTQIVHSTLFKNAGKIHCYWIYYGGVAVAIGGATLIGTTWDTMEKLLKNGKIRKIALTVFAAVISILLIIQWNFAWRQLLWGFNSGHAAYVGKNYYDQYEEIMWARELHKLFPREKSYFLVHSSIVNRRIEFNFYLDTPHRSIRNISSAETLKRKGKDTVLIIDTKRISLAGKQDLEIISRQHPLYVWNRRFVAVVLSRKFKEPVAFKSINLPHSLLWKWLVNPNHPPIKWVKDNAKLPEITKKMFPENENLYFFNPAGGKGGGRFSWICPDENPVSSIKVKHKRNINYLIPFCASAAGKEETKGPAKGNIKYQGKWKTLSCNEGEKAVGFTGKAGRIVNKIALICKNSQGVTRTSESAGTDAGKNFRFICPNDFSIAGISGREGAAIDAIAPVCRKDVVKVTTGEEKGK